MAMVMKRMGRRKRRNGISGYSTNTTIITTIPAIIVFSRLMMMAKIDYYVWISI
jgi:hypothetical protein